MQQKNHRSISLLLFWKCFLLICLPLWTLPTLKKRLENLKKNVKNVKNVRKIKKKRKTFFVHLRRWVFYLHTSPRWMLTSHPPSLRTTPLAAVISSSVPLSVLTQPSVTVQPETVYATVRHSPTAFRIRSYTPRDKDLIARLRLPRKFLSWPATQKDFIHS